MGGILWNVGPDQLRLNQSSNKRQRILKCSAWQEIPEHRRFQHDALFDPLWPVFSQPSSDGRGVSFKQDLSGLPEVNTDPRPSGTPVTWTRVLARVFVGNVRSW